MPIIQFKTQHQHPKTKSSSISQSKSINIITNQPPLINSNNTIINQNNTLVNTNNPFNIQPPPNTKTNQINIKTNQINTKTHQINSKTHQIHTKSNQIGLKSQPQLQTNIISKQPIIKSKQHTKKQKSQKQFTKQQSYKKQPIKQSIKQPIKQPILSKQQKPLRVQIIKKQKQNNQSIQASTQQVNDKKLKKKKNKRQQLPIQDEISPQQRLTNKTIQLYTLFIQKHKIPFQYQHPQLMTLLKQSFTPFAYNQIQSQKQLLLAGQDISACFNPSKQYNQFLFDQLKKRKNFHEDRIFLGVLQQNQLFNDLIWRQQIYSQPKKQQVSLLFNDIHLMVINDVWQGQYEIKNKQKASKDQILYGSYKANQIRMAQSIIKQKLTNLNEQFTINVQSNGQKQQQDINKYSNHKKYDINSQQTKKAQQFVKKLQQQQKLAKQRAKKLKQLQQQQQIKKLQLQQQLKRKQHQSKLQQRRHKLLQKAQQRQKQKKYRQQQQKLYQQYLREHRQKIPLFKKKQSDFQQFLIKQHIKKLQTMKQIQKHKRSISKDQIQLHQAKYKQLKSLLAQQRNQLLKLQSEETQDRQQTFYKGQFHNSIMSQVDKWTISEQKKSKVQELYTKKIQYATNIKTKFMPKIDIKKKQQLQKLISDLAPKIKDDKYTAEKTKMQGQRNLQKLHQFMGQMRAKGKIKKSSTPPSSTLSQQKSSRYVNYLSDLKSTRMNNSSSMRKSRFTSLDVSKMNRNSLGMIQLQAMNLQQLADRKSLFLKNTKNLDMQDYLCKKFELEQDYIESAKAKMQVIEQYYE